LQDEWIRCRSFQSTTWLSRLSFSQEVKGHQPGTTVHREAGLGLCSQKHRTAGSCELVTAREKNRGRWDAAAE